MKALNGHFSINEYGQIEFTSEIDNNEIGGRLHQALLPLIGEVNDINTRDKVKHAITGILAEYDLPIRPIIEMSGPSVIIRWTLK